MDLSKFDTTTLAKIWNKLNEWKWADELGEKPEGYDTMINFSNDESIPSKYLISRPIMNDIFNKIGYKECLRWHHVNNLNSTNEKFEQWWNKNIKNNMIDFMLSKRR